MSKTQEKQIKMAIHSYWVIKEKFRHVNILIEPKKVEG